MMLPGPGSLAAGIECGLAGRALNDAPESGDLHAVVVHDDGAIVAAIDGLGHGPQAALAARTAAAVITQHAREPVDALMRRCHQSLRGTRGAAMTLVALDARHAALTWLGVGNVDAILLRADPGATPAREAIALPGGVVGYHLPALRPSAHRLAAGDTLVLATDGIRSNFVTGLTIRCQSPQEIAQAVLRGHGKDSDDALVVVVRYLGILP